jgi:thiol-disulfide isomerase/thioredoxin
LYSSDSSGDSKDSAENTNDKPPSTTAASTVFTNVTAPEKSQFGDVAPMRRKSPSDASAAQFGDVVSIRRPSSSSSAPTLFEESTPKATAKKSSTGLTDVEMLKQRRTRNIAVAILSVCLAVGNYAYEWTHPVTPIQLLVNMEKTSAPLSYVGTNSKPTVIDFWAPWCENCRYMAPTLYQVEETYKDKVNFVMVNGDDPNNWPLIEALGVDAIPHMSLIESDGTVDTALIGAVPREWLSQDIDVMLENANKLNSGQQTPNQPLPYKMLDVFANRPEARKIVDLEAVFEAGRRR